MAVSTTLYVSNLPASATEESLAGKFGRFGTVVAVSLSQDLATSKMRRGSIEMKTVEQARHAMNGLNFSEYDGRLMAVHAALVREPAAS